MRVGDIVVLKGKNNSGVEMTVEYIGKNDIRCVWFIGSGFLQRESFTPGSLQLAFDEAGDIEGGG